LEQLAVAAVAATERLMAVGQRRLVRTAAVGQSKR